MVSPKRKLERIPNLYIANNVKTSTLSDQNDTTNLPSNKNNLLNSRNYNNCIHTSTSMVPEKDTSPSKVSSGSSVDSLKFPVTSGDANNMNDHKMISSRPHHHASVQELRLQVRS